MTAIQIAKDADYDIHTQSNSRPARPAAAESTIGRINSIEMMCQVATMGGDTLLLFSVIGGGKQPPVENSGPGRAASARQRARLYQDRLKPQILRGMLGAFEGACKLGFASCATYCRINNDRDTGEKER